jgi:hypothetical protein
MKKTKKMRIFLKSTRPNHVVRGEMLMGSHSSGSGSVGLVVPGHDDVGCHGASCVLLGPGPRRSLETVTRPASLPVRRLLISPRLSPFIALILKELGSSS